MDVSKPIVIGCRLRPTLIAEAILGLRQLGEEPNSKSEVISLCVNYVASLSKKKDSLLADEVKTVMGQLWKEEPKENNSGNAVAVRKLFFNRWGVCPYRNRLYVVNEVVLDCLKEITPEAFELNKERFVVWGSDRATLKLTKPAWIERDEALTLKLQELFSELTTSQTEEK